MEEKMQSGRQEAAPRVRELPSVVPFVPCGEAHPEISCLGKALLNARSTGLYGIVLNFPFHALTLLLPLLGTAYRLWAWPTKRKWQKVLWLTLSNTMWSAFFFGSFGFLFSALYCLLRNIRKKDDEWSPFLAGLLSGPAIMNEQEERRTELLLFAMPRFAEVLWRMAEKRGYVRPVPFGVPALFSIALGVLMYTYRWEPQALRPPYRTMIRHIFSL